MATVHSHTDAAGRGGRRRAGRPHTKRLRTGPQLHVPPQTKVRMPHQKGTGRGTHPSARVHVQGSTTKRVSQILERRVRTGGHTASRKTASVDMVGTVGTRHGHCTRTTIRPQKTKSAHTCTRRRHRQPRPHDKHGVWSSTRGQGQATRTTENHTHGPVGPKTRPTHRTQRPAKGTKRRTCGHGPGREGRICQDCLFHLRTCRQGRPGGTRHHTHLEGRTTLGMGRSTRLGAPPSTGTKPEGIAHHQRATSTGPGTRTTQAIHQDTVCPRTATTCNRPSRKHHILQRPTHTRTTRVKRVHRHTAWNDHGKVTRRPNTRTTHTAHNRFRNHARVKHGNTRVHCPVRNDTAVCE